jgi:hypothetical protein
MQEVMGTQVEIFRDEVLFCYPFQSDLEQLLSTKMDMHLVSRARGDNYETIVHNLVIDLRSKRILDDFIKAFLQDRPKSTLLFQLWDNILASVGETIFYSVYEKVLPDGAEDWQETSKNRLEILEKLDRFRKLDMFLSNLINCQNINISIPDYLRKLIRTPEPEIQKTNELSKLEAYLLIFIDKSSEHDKPFLLKSWLLENDDSDAKIPINQDIGAFYRSKLPQYQALLDGDDNYTGIFCRFDDIENIVDQVIQEAEDKLWLKDYNLKIEIFLTPDLLNKEVEWWSMTTNDDGDKVCLGTKYTVRMRLSNRLRPRNLKSNLPQWRDNWKKLHEFYQDKSIQEIFELYENCDCSNWEAYLKDFTSKIDYQQKFGLRLNYESSETKLLDLFKAIWSAAIPIVCWTRLNPQSSLYQEVNTDNSINAQKLCDLCEHVKKIRYQAYDPTTKSKNPNHVGAHLSVLWENPYRLPPDALIKLRILGE